MPPVEEEFTAVQLTAVQKLLKAESWCRCEYMVRDRWRDEVRARYIYSCFWRIGGTYLVSPRTKYWEITIVSNVVLYLANAEFENFNFVCSSPMVIASSFRCLIIESWLL